MASVVLFSGGLDSAVLLAAERRAHDVVWPVYVRSGLAWEDAEQRAARRLLTLTPFAGRVQPLMTLDVDMRDVYSDAHWAVRGAPPAYDTPDEDVYLEGRNLVLIAKAAVLCASLGADRLAVGLLAGNPFPDATPAFLSAMTAATSLALNRPLDIATPFRELHKSDVIQLGRELGVPLDATLSCMSPIDDRPCGQCSKCRERTEALVSAGDDIAVRRSTSG